MRLTVLATLSALLVGFISDVAGAPQSVVVTPKERSAVPGMSMGRFLYCINDADKPLDPKSNNIDVPSPLKDKPPPRTSFDWECSGDLD
jgi:hypothetical protein